MPEIIAPGTGLTPPSNRSVIPTNNVHTIQDVLDGRKYVLPGSGGNWGTGEDLPSSYKDEGSDYKRKERDAEILWKMTAPKDGSEEKWKVKVPGGARTFPSFQMVQDFQEKMRQKGVPIQWVSRVAQSSNRVQVISSSLKKTFKVESIDKFKGVKETGSCFNVSPYHFVTCAHVISKNSNLMDDFELEDYSERFDIHLIQNGKKVPASVVAINNSWDVAIIKSDILVDNFDLDVASMQIGDEILTIGSPHGFENNSSFGHVGSIGKDIFAHQNAPKMFFIDAPVFQGNSGGPIVKIENGEVLGMLTSIVAKEGEYGLNVGLPSSYIKNFCIMNGIQVT